MRREAVVIARLPAPARDASRRCARGSRDADAVGAAPRGRRARSASPPSAERAAARARRRARRRRLAGARRGRDRARTLRRRRPRSPRFAARCAIRPGRCSKEVDRSSLGRLARRAAGADADRAARATRSPTCGAAPPTRSASCGCAPPPTRCARWLADPDVEVRKAAARALAAIARQLTPEETAGDDPCSDTHSLRALSIVTCLVAPRRPPAPRAPPRPSASPIGTQDTTINCATGGLVVRELNLLEKYLPHDGQYKDVHYDISWKNFTAGAPLTSEMVAHKLDFAPMADFPSVLERRRLQEAGRGAASSSRPLSASVTGGGNGILVPVDSPVQSLRELKGKQISVPFGSTVARHAAARDPRPRLGSRARRRDHHADAGGRRHVRSRPARSTRTPTSCRSPSCSRTAASRARSTTARRSACPPTHGLLVTGAFADKYPEIVVAFLRATLEADRLFAADPEKLSELIQR